MNDRRQALFLDRDGVIFHAPPRGEYLVNWDQCRLVEGVAALARAARDRGYLVVVVTNQSQVAKGLFDAIRKYQTSLKGEEAAALQ